MVTDQIADLLTRIRNAQRVGHLTVAAPASSTKTRILDVLVQEGYIEKYDVSEVDGKRTLNISLKYSMQGEPVIKEITRISSPGCRKYVRKRDIGLFKHGLGTVIVSTSKGMLSDREARLQGVGGELICSVF